MKHISTLVLLVCFFASPVFSQKRIFSTLRDTTKFNNRKYKQELGVDIQGIFNGLVGNSLIWKIRDDKSKLVPVSYSDFWRVQVGLRGRFIEGKRDTFNFTDYTIEQNVPSYSYHNVWARIGKERNNFSNKFNFYYGWEAGPNFGYNNFANYYISPIYENGGGIVGYGTFNNTIKSLDIGVGGDVFLGVKYHFTERISISFEAAFFCTVIFSHDKESVTWLGETIKKKPEWKHEISYDMDYLRFITLNYHFKQY